MKTHVLSLIYPDHSGEIGDGFFNGLSELYALLESHGGFEVRSGPSEDADTFVAIVPCSDEGVQRQLMTLSQDNARILCFVRAQSLLSTTLVEELSSRSGYQMVIPFTLTHQIYWQILGQLRPQEIVTCAPGTMIEECIRQKLI